MTKNSFVRKLLKATKDPKEYPDRKIIECAKNIVRDLPEGFPVPESFSYFQGCVSLQWKKEDFHYHIICFDYHIEHTITFFKYQDTSIPDKIVKLFAERK